VEGCGRSTPKQLLYHLNVALGSSFELETQILIVSDLTYIENIKSNILIEKIQEIIKMIIGLKKRVKE